MEWVNAPEGSLNQVIFWREESIEKRRFLPKFSVNFQKKYFLESLLRDEFFKE